MRIFFTHFTHFTHCNCMAALINYHSMKFHPSCNKTENNCICLSHEHLCCCNSLMLCDNGWFINQWCCKIPLSKVNAIILTDSFYYFSAYFPILRTDGLMRPPGYQAVCVWHISIFETTNQFSQNFVSTGKDEDGHLIINNGKCKILMYRNRNKIF